MPSMATDDMGELPLPDLCLVCVKGYDLSAALMQMAPVVSEKTVIIPLMNGVDIYDRIRGVIKNAHIFPACVYIGAHIEKPGVVIQRGGRCTIHFGGDPRNGYMDSRIPALFDRAGIKYDMMDNPYSEIWGKFIFIAAYGLVTAYSGKTIGQVLESQELSGYVRSIMNEVVDIARAGNVQLSAAAAEDSFLKGKAFPYDTKTSLQRDYEVIDKRDERDLFGGTIIRLGRERGIATPVAGFIYTELDKRKPAP